MQAGSREELRQMLASRQSGGIIFTTVQKFSLLEGEERHPALTNRSNVVVISDEAHRSQYGLKAVLDQKTGVFKFGYAKHLRDAMPLASFIGFTGTPIATEDKDTRAVFGDYVSIYDIQDAVDDGATVPIYYESRLAKLDINQAEIEKLNDDVEEVVEDEEDVNSREKTKSNWAALEKLVGAKPRLQQVAEDLNQTLRGAQRRAGRQGHDSGDEPRNMRAFVRCHYCLAPAVAQRRYQRRCDQGDHDQFGLR